MKSKSIVPFLILIFTSFFTGCKSDIDADLLNLQQMGDLLIEDKVNRLVYIQDKRYVEVWLKPEGNELKAVRPDFLVMNLEESYYIGWYSDFVEDVGIVNPPSLEFDNRPDFSDFIESYGFLLVLLIIPLIVIILLIKQYSTIKKLRSQVDKLEEQLFHKNLKN